MAIIALRTIIIYIVIMVALRLAGKRQLGELQPAELVVTLLVADLAAVPMQDNGTPLLNGLIPLVILIALELILSALMLKCSWLSRLVSGNPVILIRDGVLQQRTLKQMRLSVDDITESMRQQSIFDIHDVQYAIAETNGTISFFLFPAARAATVGDLQIHLSDDGAPVPVISDGSPVDWGMTLCGVSIEWLHTTLKKHKCAMKDVLLMTADKQHHVCIIQREASL